MPSYVAFLRAINLGAKRKVPMADLKPALAEAGFTDVDTYIATGNVRCSTRLRSSSKVVGTLEDLLADRYGFEVPVMLFTLPELAQVYADALAMQPPPYAQEDGHTGRFVSFFKDPVDRELFGTYTSDEDQLVVGERVVHLWTSGVMTGSPVFAELARALEPGTSRSLKVVRTLTERWC